jgi:hypothetical protein
MVPSRIPPRPFEKGGFAFVLMPMPDAVKYSGEYPIVVFSSWHPFDNDTDNYGRAERDQGCPSFLPY